MAFKSMKSLAEMLEIRKAKMHEDQKNLIESGAWVQVPETPNPDATSTPKFSPECKVEPEARLSKSTLIRFNNLENVTQEGNPTKGAILVSYPDPNGEYQEQWIPKKLCCNLNTAVGTVYVWEVFAEANLQGMISS